MYSVTIDIGDEDCGLSEAAASWCRKFYGDIAVSLDSGRLTLTSAVRDEPALEAAWIASLANERLFRSARDFRAAVTGRLAQ